MNGVNELPTRKLESFDVWTKEFCQHPEHNPPTMMVFEPGLYEHECPCCGKRQRFYVGPKPRLSC